MRVFIHTCSTRNGQQRMPDPPGDGVTDGRELPDVGSNC